MSNWQIICDDVINWAGNYKGPPFMAMLCDPPYELGFMSRDWDKSGIAFQSATWAALAQHLHPGAWVMAFASSRGWHRLAVAIEDAGMVIQPSIFGWATGQSFPKATRIDTQIDKRAGKLEEREVVGHRGGRYDYGFTSTTGAPMGNISPRENSPTNKAKSGYIMKPATALARAWVGHRYGGQVLKNAVEPLILAQKPLTIWQKYGKLVEETTLLMEGFLCQFINAKVAEKSLRGQERTLKGVNESSVRLSASLIQFALNRPQDSGQTDMWQLSEGVSILLNIVWLWNNIWDALWNLGNLSTTSMETQAITVLRILRSWLQANIPACITEAVFHLSGRPFSVQVAESNSTDLKASSDLKTSVLGNATKDMEKGSAGKSVSSVEKSSIPKVNSSEDQGVFVLLNAAMKAGKSQEDLTFLARSAEKLLESLLGQLRTLSTTNANGVQSESSLRPIICAQKPWQGKRLDCIVETGAGALWVDGGRIGVEILTNQQKDFSPVHGNRFGDGSYLPDKDEVKVVQGRWPANFTLTHSPLDDGGGCHESCPVRRLGEQSGERRPGAPVKGTEPSRTGGEGTSCYGEYRRIPSETYNDRGTAARFFHQSDWFYEIAERLALADPVRYCAKSSRKERDISLTNFVTLELGVCLCGENTEQVTSLERVISEYVMGLENQLCSTDLSGSGRMGQCHQVILSTMSMETDKTIASKTWNVLTSLHTKEFIAGVIGMIQGCGSSLVGSVENISQLLNTMSGNTALARGAKYVVSETPLKISASAKPRRNSHPCLKPIALTRWLATLLLPPPEYAPRRLLVPFAGTGSEGIGALLAGWDEVVMVDNNAEYCEIAEGRTKWWAGWSQRAGATEPKEILKAAKDQPVGREG